MTSKHVLLGLLIVAVFATGYMIGRSSTDGGGTFVPAISNGTKTGTDTNATTKDSESNAPKGSASSGTIVNTSNLSDGQKAMLKALGINTDTLVVTPQMIACAEASIGASRTEEIKNGATPSFSEGAKLVACYK